MDAARKEMQSGFESFKTGMTAALKEGLHEMRVLRNVAPSTAPAERAAEGGEGKSVAAARAVVEDCQGKPVGQQRTILRAQILEWGGDAEAANGENKILALINMLYMVATD